MAGKRIAARHAALLCAMAALFGLPSGADAAEYLGPDPGGSETAIVKIPPPGNRFFGYHEYGIVGGSAHGWSPKQIAEIAKNGGANMLRFTIDWRFVEPTQDSWDEARWGVYMSAYRAMQAVGIRPLIGISTAPQWARDIGWPTLCGGTRGCEYPPRPAMFGEWAEFAAEVARRFPNAAGIEIWNEPNISNFYKPAPEPARYAGLVASAYDAIKAVSPKIKVIAGALAPARQTFSTDFGTNVKMHMGEFLEAAYAASPSIKGHSDGLSFHHSSQKHKWGGNTLFAAAVKDMRRIRNRYGEPNLPLWITELGLSTSGEHGVSTETQADALLRVYRRIMTIPDFRGLIIHTLGDRVELAKNDEEYGRGLIASFEPFRVKPSFCEFAGRASANPRGGCRRIREGRVSRCTRKMVKLSVRARDSRAAARRLETVTKRCIPCARQSSLTSKCARGLRRLKALQREYRRAIITMKLDVMVRHDRVLKRLRR